MNHHKIYFHLRRNAFDRNSQMSPFNLLVGQTRSSICNEQCFEGRQPPKTDWVSQKAWQSKSWDLRRKNLSLAWLSLRPAKVYLYWHSSSFSFWSRCLDGCFESKVVQFQKHKYFTFAVYFLALLPCMRQELEQTSCCQFCPKCETPVKVEET